MADLVKQSRPSMPFFQCHSSFLKRMQHEKLTTNEIAILAYLMSNLLFGKTITRPTSYEQLAFHVDCSERSVRRALDRLSELGYLDVLYQKHREFIAEMRIVSVTRSMIKDYYKRKAEGEPTVDTKTAMPYFQLNRDNIRKLKRKKLTPAECLVFFYLLTSVDVDSGNTHHLEIKDIAEYYGYHPKTVKRAIKRLDELEFIDIKSIGFTFQADVPAVRQTKTAKKEADAARDEREKYIRAGFTDMFGRGDSDEISDEIYNALSPEVQKILDGG